MCSTGELRPSWEQCVNWLVEFQWASRCIFFLTGDCLTFGAHGVPFATIGHLFTPVSLSFHYISQTSCSVLIGLLHPYAVQSEAGDTEISSLNWHRAVTSSGQSQSLQLERELETQLYPQVSDSWSLEGPFGFLLTPPLVTRQLQTVAGAMMHFGSVSLGPGSGPWEDCTLPGLASLPTPSLPLLLLQGLTSWVTSSCQE